MGLAETTRRVSLAVLDLIAVRVRVSIRSKSAIVGETGDSMAWRSVATSDCVETTR